MREELGLPSAEGVPSHSSPAVTLEPLQPKWYQALAVMLSVGHFKEHEAGRLIFMCGLGKTLTAFFIAFGCDASDLPSEGKLRQEMGKQAKGHYVEEGTPCFTRDQIDGVIKLVQKGGHYKFGNAVEPKLEEGGYALVTVPSLYLMGQFYDEWRGQAQARGVPVRFLLVGTIEEDQAWKARGGDSLLQVTTTVGDIAEWLQREDVGVTRSVVICTYQSGGRLAEAIRRLGSRAVRMVMPSADALGKDADGASGLDEALRREGLERGTAEPDGNCLYHAFAALLGPGHDYVQLRKTAVQHMRDSMLVSGSEFDANNGFFEASAAERGLSWDEFLENAGENGIWGGEAEIIALATEFKVNVTVWQWRPGNGALMQFPFNYGGATGRSLDLLFVLSRNHYEPLRRVDGGGAPQPGKARPSGTQLLGGAEDEGGGTLSPWSFDVVFHDEAHRTAGFNKDSALLTQTLHCKTECRVSMTATERVFQAAPRRKGDAETALKPVCMHSDERFGPYIVPDLATAGAAAGPGGAGVGSGGARGGGINLENAIRMGALVDYVLRYIEEPDFVVDDNDGGPSQAVESSDERPSAGVSKAEPKAKQRGAPRPPAAVTYFEENLKVHFTDGGKEEIGRIMNEGMRERGAPGEVEAARRAHYAVSAKVALDLVAEEVEAAVAAGRRPCLHFITYHHTIKQSRLFRDLLRALLEARYGKGWQGRGLTADSLPSPPPFTWNVDYMVGAHSMPVRRALVRDFEHFDVTFLCTAHCCDEGVDFPWCNGVFFVHDTAGPILATQRAGRCLRTKDGKSGPAQIVLPVILWHREGGALARNPSQFLGLQKLLVQLADKDRAILETFRALAAGTNPPEGGRRLKVTRSGSTVEDVPGEFKTDDFFNKFVVGTATRLTAVLPRWEVWVDKLKKFRKDNPGKWPRQNAPAMEEAGLGRWARNMKTLYKENKLDPAIKAALNDVVGWEKWLNTQKTRGERLRDLMAFCVKRLEEQRLKEPGRKPGENMPQSSPGATEEEKSLARFMSKLRGLKNDGKLKPEHIEFLESIRGWDWDPPRGPKPKKNKEKTKKKTKKNKK